MQPIDWKKYIIAFFITSAVFLSAIGLSNYFNNKKLNQLKNIQDTIAVGLLSSEVQYSLIQEESCANTTESALSPDLNSLTQKIEYGERSNIGNTEELLNLKKNYSLLEIKDYLLMKRIAERCNMKSVFVLYFYKTVDCTDCEKQGYALTALREKYPGLRVYSFDYGLNLSAIETLIRIYKIKDTELPALVSGGKVYTGFQSVEDMEKLIPKLKDTLPKEEPVKVEKKAVTEEE
jgi:hypothetical protein